MLNRVHLAWAGFELLMLIAIGTDCIDSLPYDQDHDGLIFLLHEKLYYKMLCKLSFIDHNYDFFDNADNTSKIARGDILLWIPSQSDVF